MIDLTRRTLTLIATFCLATIAAPQDASANDAAPPPPIAPESAVADAQTPVDFLAGPQVAEKKVAEPADAPVMQRDGRAPITVPVRRWIRTVLKLELSADHRDAVEREITSWRQANRKFQQEHGEELSELRKQIRAARNGEVDSVADVDALRQRAREIRAKGPQIEEYQQRIWKMLEEPQQEQLREMLEEIRRRQMMERRRRAMGGSDRMMEGDAMNDGGEAGRPGRRPALEDRPGRPRSPHQRNRQRERERRVTPEKPNRAPEKVGGS